MKYLLTNGNSELRADGIFTWTLPALAAKLSNGKNFLVCPNAGVCANFCYAREGTYRFSNVKKAHLNNLELVLNNLENWEQQVRDELKLRRYRPKGFAFPYATLLDHNLMTPWVQQWLEMGGRAVRIHDSGDFFSREYLEAWVNIAKATPDVFFYAYTKEVKVAKTFLVPENFVFIFSLGGTQDHLLDKSMDRHADVFSSMAELENAGYIDQEASDLLAALMPSNKVGIVTNNLPHIKKKQGVASFGNHQLLKVV